jgi:predicted nucleic-acid-binding protein
VKRLRVDANVLLRFLTGEPEDLAERAAGLMRSAEAGEVLLILSPLVVAEIVWVLKSFYRHSFWDIAEVLVPLLSADGIEVAEREILIGAIELARDHNVDFVDAVLALEAVRDGETVCTFDAKDFKRLPAKWMSPQLP